MKQNRDLRLRFWALCQYGYDLFINYREEDCKEMRGELFRDAVRGGHLNRLCFVSMETDFPLLRSPHTLKNERLVLEFAKQHLRHYADIGRKRSGLLNGYLRAQLRHLERCERCEVFVCQAVRSDVEIGDFVRKALAESEVEPPPLDPKKFLH